MNFTPSSPIQLEKPCGACGYGSGNVIHLWGERYAIKCGGCDCFQFAFSAKKQVKQGRTAR